MSFSQFEWILCETIWNWWHRNGSVPSSLSMKLELKSRTLTKCCLRAFSHFFSFYLSLSLARSLCVNCLIRFTLGETWFTVTENIWFRATFKCVRSSFPAILMCPCEIQRKLKTSTSCQTTMTLQETGLIFLSFYFFYSHNVYL